MSHNTEFLDTSWHGTVVLNLHTCAELNNRSRQVKAPQVLHRQLIPLIIHESQTPVAK